MGYQFETRGIGIAMSNKRSKEQQNHGSSREVLERTRSNNVEQDEEQH